jgi:Cu/Ag efflux pump CusA
MGYLIQAHPDEQKPAQPGADCRLPAVLDVLRWPRATIAVAVRLLRTVTLRIGGGVMPPLDEGDLLYMLTVLPALSAGKHPSCRNKPTG